MNQVSKVSDGFIAMNALGLILNHEEQPRIFSTEREARDFDPGNVPPLPQANTVRLDSRRFRRTRV